MTTRGYFDNGATVVALAHRGFSLDGLENSMAAFGAAVDLGFRYVETDVHGTRDGKAVALHDASLDRTTDGHGEVANLNWAEVRGAKIGGVEPVPLLEDLLGTWPTLNVNIDVKGTSGIAATAEAIERTHAHDRVCLASFSTARREATVALLSRPVATSAGTREAAAFFAGGFIGANMAAPLVAVDAVQVPVKMGVVPILTRRHIAAAHAARKQVHVWTINDKAEMARLVAMGVDGIVSDRADILKEYLVTIGRWQ
jgi:glycerophosphoryl diester phosphodiesterase